MQVRSLGRRFSAVFLVCFFGAFCFGQEAGTVEYFETNIRPVLLEQCAGCHNSKLRTAGLDFTTTESIASSIVSGSLISKEHPADSVLLSVLSYSGKVKMPPTGRLPEAAIQKFVAWVNAGAAMPAVRVESSVKARSGVLSPARTGHWSFQPVRAQAPPAIKQEGWAQSPIDRFILAKLEEKGLAPPKRADKATLIRRAKYDLLGLPPTEQELKDFVADSSPDAFAKLIDRYLASPQYGEKWGRHWLDVARYAESAGVDDNDPYTDAWRYREYVIDALNRDVPFDQMIREQLAGDLLPSADKSPVNVRGRVATGFLALGPKATVEMDKMKTAYDVIDEQIDATSKAFLGLTVACARCHDHKFDPIPTRDYYSMAAIFASTKSFENVKGDFFTERKSKLYQAPLVDQQVFEDYLAAQKKIAAKNMQAQALLDNEYWNYQTANVFPKISDYMSAAWRSQHGGSAAELAAAKQLDQTVLQGWIKYLDPKSGFRPHLDRWHKATAADVEALSREYAGLFQKTALNWGNELRQWKQNVDAAVRGERELPKAPNIEYNSKTAFTDPSERFFAEVVIPARTFNDKTSKDGPLVVSEKDEEAVLSASAKEQLAALRRESADLTKAAPPRPPMANAVAEGTHVDQHIFVRGSYSNPGEAVSPAGPTIFKALWPQPVQQGSGRKELAAFIASPANPLTSRVIVNRLWLWHFGEGLVRTPNNFGLAGEAPTHPELLDYLATEFVKSGWSMKAMHRSMMLTSLYQSDSTISEQAERVDPANRLWSRFQRRRMTVEEMRDTWLSLAGSLDLKMGGIFDPVDPETTGRGPGRGARGAANPRSFDVSRRRTVYVAINRTAIATPMVLYDFVDSSTSAGDRPETIIAPQALYLMNNPFVVKNATAFAARLLSEKDATDEKRIRQAYEDAWQREPSLGEIESASRYIRSYPASAESKFGGWESFCRILLSANQFHFID